MSDPLMPPPTYEVSQQDLDRKVTEAMLASLESLQGSEEQWEEWDEAKFHAAAQAHHAVDHNEAGGSSTATSFPAPRVDPTLFEVTIQPLHINKKGPQAVAPKTKERPSWLAEAGLDDPSSSSAAVQSDSAPSASSSSAGGQSMGSSVLHSVHELSTEDVDEDTIAPPPFAEVAPLDSPPFEQIPPLPMPAFHGASSNPSSRLGSPPFPEIPTLPTTAFHGISSSPPSPLSSPVQPNATLPPASSVPVIVHNRPSPPPQQRQSLQPPRRPVQRMGPRPYTASYANAPYMPVRNETNPSLPYMRFDPSMAYQKSRRDSPPSQVKQLQAPAYTSFYK
jgi:hypothetical protein